MKRDWIDLLFNILFWVCLLSPVLLFSSLIAYLIGSFLSKANDKPNPTLAFAKKMMLFASLMFAIGMGACFTLMQFYNPYISYNPHTP